MHWLNLLFFQFCYPELPLRLLSLLSIMPRAPFLDLHGLSPPIQNLRVPRILWLNPFIPPSSTEAKPENTYMHFCIVISLLPPLPISVVLQAVYILEGNCVLFQDSFNYRRLKNPSQGPAGNGVGGSRKRMFNPFPPRPWPI